MTTEQQLVQAMKKTLPKDVINHIKGFVKVKKTFRIEVSSEKFQSKLALLRDDDVYVLDLSDFKNMWNTGEPATNIRTESWTDFKSIVEQHTWKMCEFYREARYHEGEDRVDINLDFYLKTPTGRNHLRELYVFCEDCSFECICDRMTKFRDKLSRLLDNYRPYLHAHYC